MFGGSSSNTRTYDRLIGFFVTIGAVLTLGAASKFVKNLYSAHKKEEERRRRHTTGDAQHETRWKNAQGPLVMHDGACHCERIRFRVRASRTVYAVDVPKVRFPRLTIPVENFEPLTDESIMSLYAVKTADKGIGIHTFCSFCGVHVVYAPDTDPSEIQVNVDCLDKSSVDKVFVSYLATVESSPVPVAYEAARPFNRRGTGAFARDAVRETQSTPQTAAGSSHDSSSMLRNMYMLEGGVDAERFRSPEKANSDPWEIRESTSRSVISPFSRNQQLNNIRSRYVEDACSSYLDSYYTAGQGHGSQAGNSGLGPYGGFNDEGQFDHPLYSQAAPERTAQWNRYYSSVGQGLHDLGQSQKEALDGEVAVSDRMTTSGYGSLVPSPIKLRSFAETTNAAFGLSPGAFTKQLDSMKQHLSHYPAPEDDLLSTHPRLASL